MTPPTIDPPVCVALDVPSRDEARRLLDVLGGRVRVCKIGLELFTAAGPPVVEDAIERGLEVVLDLKVHDIPNTAAGCVRAAAGTGARYLTVHAAGGRRMLEAAVAAAGGGMRLLAVTVLTSLGPQDLVELGLERSAAELVEKAAGLALGAGVQGLVCAPPDVARLRRRYPGAFLLVPGIRLAGAGRGDQRRTGTPQAAVEAGADLVVVGRAVVGAPDPGAALDRILASLGAAA